jgi:hypothetical protein
MTDSVEYRAWNNMKNRCSNPNVRAYPHYGGRGISVCQEWIDSFSTFLSHMGLCPSGYSLERLDVNGNYSPWNCVWIPLSQQGRNKRNVRVVDGETMREISARSGIKYDTVHYRLTHGIALNKEVGRAPRITFSGKTMTQAEWADELGLARSTISMRIKRGLSIEQVLTP